MNLLLCTADPLLDERWDQILGKEHMLYRARSISEIERYTKAVNLDLIMLHRSLVDLDFIRSLESPFFIFADVPDDNEAVIMLRLGALGYSNSYISSTRLMEAVNVALSGRVWVGRQLMQKIILGTTAVISESAAVASLKTPLTERELEAAQLIKKGWSNLQIAQELKISERTVKAHVGSLFKKTGTSSRLQLALFMNNLTADQETVNT